MKNAEQLKKILERVDGRGYKNYNTIKGIYDFDFFTLHIDHVQRDPFAGPSLIRISTGSDSFPKAILKNQSQRVAVADYIGRKFGKSIEKHATRMGSGKSGLIQIDSGGPEILDRTSVKISEEKLEIRFSVGLPARGRRILGNESRVLFFELIPQIIKDSCTHENINPENLLEHVRIYEDSNFLRQKIKELGLVAFVRNGAILPRESGVSERPLKNAVPFKSPESLNISVETPYHGIVTGMGIPEGVVLIVGGGYHGKSTILNAIERGIYNHGYGDGREMVVTDPNAVKIRAEDGRKIESVDISSFIHNPPLKKDTSKFSSENASGSTSQAANIVEAIEVGADLLMFDEDTSATNFMIRDERMQKLVSKDKEPITPFIDRVKELKNEHEISTIMVMGGSGDYFEVADTVIMMDNYVPYDVTEEAMKIRDEIPINRKIETSSKFNYKKRCPVNGCINPNKGKKLKLDVRGKTKIMLGNEIVDLSQVEQLVDTSQTRAIVYAMNYISPKYINGKMSMKQLMDQIKTDIDAEGLDILAPRGRKYPNNISKPRIFEIAAALNRLRTFKVKNCDS
jgi:predicted ABC-class ATPase